MVGIKMMEDTMKHFKNKNNEIYAYDDEQIKQGYGKNLEPVTDIEAKKIIETKSKKQEQERFNSLTYAEKRAEAYPPLTDQADMAYWDRQNGTKILDDVITAVKKKYPKPTGG